MLKDGHVKSPGEYNDQAQWLEIKLNWIRCNQNLFELIKSIIIKVKEMLKDRHVKPPGHYSDQAQWLENTSN